MFRGSKKNEDLVFQSGGRFLKKDIKVSRYVYGSDAGVAAGADDDDACLMLCKFGRNPMATEGSTRLLLARALFSPLIVCLLLFYDSFIDSYIFRRAGKK